ncbi:conserved hypothetical protein [Vibrio sp. 16]|nr:conserved hypothetical protein [Vibrio sp. 16]
MMNFFKTISVTLSAALLFGCALPAQVKNMKVDGAVNHQYDENLTNSVTIDKVSGGKWTNPLLQSEIGSDDFSTALKSSLQSQQLLAETENSVYALSADIVEVDQPLAGLDMTVTSSIQYRLIEKSSGKVLFNELITAAFTASTDDAFDGMQRLKIANEGSAKANIAQFLSQLSRLDVANASIELPQ